MKANRRSKQASEVGVPLPSVSVADDKQHYEKRVRELECENEALQNEIKELKHRLANGSSNSSQKLRGDYLQKLNILEYQVEELKKKLDGQSQLSTRKKGDGPTKESDFEIQSLKAQKVQLQCKIKLESVQFRLCKTALEKEVLQLKKENRKNKFEVNKILASNQRLKMVLQRKTEEASAATKRLKELIESRKTSRRRSGGGNGNTPEIQGIEDELGVTERLHELCAKYEHQIEEMTEEVSKLKEEADMLKQEQLSCPVQDKEVDLLEKDMEINDLKGQMVNLSGLIRQLQIQKTELNLGHRLQLAADMGDSSISVGSNDPSDRTNTSEVSHSKGINIARGKSALEVCCSCSKKSLCKTTKCKCRSSGGSCGTSCGCAPNKCCNREVVTTKLNEWPQQEMTSVSGNSSGLVASQGSLQGELHEKPAEISDVHGRRQKPLSDIRNTMSNQMP